MSSFTLNGGGVWVKKYALCVQLFYFNASMYTHFALFSSVFGLCGHVFVLSPKWSLEELCRHVGTCFTIGFLYRRWPDVFVKKQYR